MKKKHFQNLLTNEVSSKESHIHQMQNRVSNYSYLTVRYSLNEIEITTLSYNHDFQPVQGQQIYKTFLTHTYTHGTNVGQE